MKGDGGNKESSYRPWTLRRAGLHSWILRTARLHWRGAPFNKQGRTLSDLLLKYSAPYNSASQHSLVGEGDDRG